MSRTTWTTTHAYRRAGGMTLHAYLSPFEDGWRWSVHERGEVLQVGKGRDEKQAKLNARRWVEAEVRRRVRR